MKYILAKIKNNKKYKLIIIALIFAVPFFIISKYLTLVNNDVDIIPICNWNKEKRGEIFHYKDDSLVVIRGRIETLNQQIVIVCETITYLGLNH